MIKAAFFDLDGTIMDPQTHTIPQSSIETIDKLQNNGIKVFVASGRQYNALSTMAGVMDIAWDGYICSNGGAVYNKEGELISGSFFKSEQVEALIKKCELEGLKIYLRCEEKDFAPLGVNQYVIEAHNFFDEPLPSLIKPYQNERVIMALIYAPMDYDFYSVKEIEGLQAFPNRSTYADICLSHISKEAGLKSIESYLHITTDEMIAFGDQNNDLEMIRYAGIGVAMGNGSDEVKEAANYTTDDCDKDGILKACKHFKLID